MAVHTKTSGTVSSLPEALEGLEPAPIWRFFAELSAIPRPSYHEERVLEWLKVFASERGLECSQDARGNMVILRPGTGGGQQALPVIIQGHVDMVTEKLPTSTHDFHTDPIRLIREDGWITADGTTLGADNGLGVATALALLDEPATTALPPLECLFTVDEEKGMTGASNLDGSMLRGRVLVNLDSEEWGDIFIGSAGGGDCVLTLPLARAPLPAGWEVRAWALGGLLGGHSGLDIDKGRANAIRVAARLVHAALSSVPEGRAALVRLQGGSERNAIPRAARVAVAASPEDLERHVVPALEAAYAEMCVEYAQREPRMELRPSEDGARHVLSPDATERLLLLLFALPHGPLAMSASVPGLVETSSNLAAVHVVQETPEAMTVQIPTLSRSSLDAALRDVRVGIQRLSRAAGAEIEVVGAYPGWNPVPDSLVVQMTREAMAHVTGTEPRLKALHAGLECGIIGEKVPGCQCVSFGPNITGAHSPDERVEIATVEPFYATTKALLAKLAARREA